MGAVASLGSMVAHMTTLGDDWYYHILVFSNQSICLSVYHQVTYQLMWNFMKMQWSKPCWNVFILSNIITKKAPMGCRNGTSQGYDACSNCQGLPSLVSSFSGCSCSTIAHSRSWTRQSHTRLQHCHRTIKSATLGQRKSIGICLQVSQKAFLHHSE